MKPKYVIQSQIDQGYWSERHRDFKGVVFATTFDSNEEAVAYIEKVMPKFTPTQVMTVLPIYQK